MRNTAILATAAALMIAGTAQADNHAGGPSIYSWMGTVNATLVGGVGPESDQYVGAKWSETLDLTTPDGSKVAVTAKCVGMSMPDRRPFERHITCDMEGADGGKGSVVMGCNPDTAPRTMRCMGLFEGTAGGVKDRASLVTSFYKFNEDGTGMVEGSGHWIR